MTNGNQNDSRLSPTPLAFFSFAPFSFDPLVLFTFALVLIPDGRTLHARKAARAEGAQRDIYRALGIDAAPGGVKKMIV